MSGARTIFLDTGVLGFITHPKGSEEAEACTKWLLALMQVGSRVCLPEICDYELRREYVLRDSKKALEKLDRLKESIEYIPIQTPMMVKAADLWAQVRAQGRQTADSKALDGDVILAAQAHVTSPGANFEIATTNVGHLSLFAKASEWKDITPE